MAQMLVGVFIAGLIQIVGHYFPWRMWRGGKELGILARYGWGVSGIMAGYFVWALLATESLVPPVWALGVALLMCFASGATTLGCYGLDVLAERVHYAHSRDTMDEANRVVMK